MGQHHMDICGAGDAIQRHHLLQLADEGGVPGQKAEDIIDQMLEQAAWFAGRAKTTRTTRATKQQLQQAVARCSRRLKRV